MTRSKLFWAALVLMAVLLSWYSISYFSEAFPIANITVTMDRQEAFQQAEALADEFDIGLDSYDQAASFDVDSRVQNFVELEGGGKSAFNEMMANEYYEPYTWRVRHYKEGKTTESYFYFTPEGEPYGFRLNLPEGRPGPQLPADSARRLAEKAAQTNWNVALENYRLIEATEKEQPGGRLDHTFVYERPDIQVGDGKYRLSLRFAGDQLAAVNYFVKIPEAFSRRYAEMRSANNTLASGASIAMGLLYILGGVIGLVLLMRYGWLLWRKAILWALFIAFMQFLANMNQIPLMWMSYDTAVSAQSFLTQQIISSLGQFLFMALLMALSFMIAETFSRKAFPNMPQFWKLWNTQAGGSKPVLGQTVAGYLLVAVFFAYNVTLYLFASKWLGWWNPSNILFQPNILANVAPWFNPIARSLQAGFWEECLFRAVPLAGAALLGNRYGGKKWWIGAALIIQALIFGAAHANYPAQPAYARMVELILPSLGFGLLYLGFGLLPAIVLHFAYDVVWFAMPLFVSDASGIMTARILVIAATLIPLWVILWGWYRNGQLRDSIDAFRNRAWQPKLKNEEEKADEEVLTGQKKREPAFSDSVFLRNSAIAGGIGILLTALFINFEHYGSEFQVGKAQAKKASVQTLKERYPGVSLDKWEVMTTVSTPLNQNDRFVWQEGGPKVYRQLFGNYLGPPLWYTRFAQFSGEVEERAEEYRVAVNGAGEIWSLEHKLPEAAPGDSLSENDAKMLADSAVRAKWDLNPRELKMIEISPKERPNRHDWSFTYADTAFYPLSQGEARAVVSIAGSEVVDAYRMVHVPQEWERQKRNERSVLDIISQVSSLLIAVLVIAAFIIAVIRWTRDAFHLPSFAVVTAFMLLLGLVSFILNWPATVAGFSTSEPYSNQFWMSLLTGILGQLAIAAGAGILSGMLMHRVVESNDRMSLRNTLISGIGLGFLFAGVMYALNHFEPSLSPNWPAYGMLNASLPAIDVWAGALRTVIIMSLAVGLIVFLLEDVTNNWQQRKAIGWVLILVIGLVFSGAGESASIGWLLVKVVTTGLLIAVAYLGWLRFGMAVIPMMVGIRAALNYLQDGMHLAIPGAGWIYSIAILLVVGLAIALTVLLKRVQPAH